MPTDPSHRTAVRVAQGIFIAKIETRRLDKGAELRDGDGVTGDVKFPRRRDFVVDLIAWNLITYDLRNPLGILFPSAYAEIRVGGNTHKAEIVAFWQIKPIRTQKPGVAELG